jgi:hypothetical protein
LKPFSISYNYDKKNYAGDAEAIRLYSGAKEMVTNASNAKTAAFYSNERIRV